MGRRALRNIDPRLSLDGVFLDRPEPPDRFDALVTFGREAPLEIEVGSGKGLFLANASSADPDRNFLGIEVAGKYARFAAAKLARNASKNAVIMQLDAKWVFHTYLPAECVAAVHIYFPDPWWKKRHHKRRVMTEAFLTDVQRALEYDGLLHFWTDVEQYYRESLEVLQAIPLLEGPITPPEQPAAHHLDYRTHFERRVRLQNQPVFRSQFKKTRPVVS